MEICNKKGRHLCVNALHSQPDNCCGTGCNYDGEWIWVGDQGIKSTINIKAYEIINYFDIPIIIKQLWILLYCLLLR